MKKIFVKRILAMSCIVFLACHAKADPNVKVIDCSCTIKTTNTDLYARSYSSIVADLNVTYVNSVTGQLEKYVVSSFEAQTTAYNNENNKRMEFLTKQCEKSKKSSLLCRSIGD